MPPDIRLEPFTDDHLAAFAELVDDPDVLRYTRFPDPPEPDFPPQWLGRYEQGRRDGTKEAFAVLDADGTFLGVALAVEIDRAAAEAELGYLTAPAARGRGIATAAVLELTRWALADQGLERVVLIISSGNVGSRKVAERAGYLRDGVLRNAYVKPGIRADTFVYSRLRSDPEPAPR
ncbi:acetyltransferase [Baekduia alba]|uniref:GNAT family N-acetyltransferase n=1 Tax=Baekduia alba TaxID=2997333 RepID=UPI00233FD3E4|nr:GNAT family protein [Baekduia alba]WCB94035.1 acetyltransferase [Baekduia alba]